MKMIFPKAEIEIKNQHFDSALVKMKKTKINKQENDVTI